MFVIVFLRKCAAFFRKFAGNYGSSFLKIVNTQT